MRVWAVYTLFPDYQVSAVKNTALKWISPPQSSHSQLVESASPLILLLSLLQILQDIRSWRRRARILVFGCIKDRETKDIQEQLKQQG